MVEVDNEGAIAWAEASLRYARRRKLSRLAMLLVVVRDEIALEMEFAKSSPLTRRGPAHSRCPKPGR